MEGTFCTNAVNPSDLWILPVSPIEKPRPFLATPSNERQGQFSPDARWIAYSSNESGRRRSMFGGFPARTASGGFRHMEARSRNGVEAARRVFYLAADGKLMAAAVRASASTFESATPQELFSTGITASFIDARNHYVVSRDGQRFLVNISAEDENSAPITVVLNWEATLKK